MHHSASREKLIRCWIVLSSGFDLSEARRNCKNLTNLDQVRSSLVVETLADASRRISEGEYLDDGFTDGIRRIFDLLWSCQEKEIVIQYGLWLIVRDRVLGLKVRRDETVSSSTDLSSSYSPILDKF